LEPGPQWILLDFDVVNLDMVRRREKYRGMRVLDKGRDIDVLGTILLLIFALFSVVFDFSSIIPQKKNSSKH
jgi:hypothetical protein